MVYTIGVDIRRGYKSSIILSCLWTDANPPLLSELQCCYKRTLLAPDPGRIDSESLQATKSATTTTMPLHAVSPRHPFTLISARCHRSLAHAQRSCNSEGVRLQPIDPLPVHYPHFLLRMRGGDLVASASKWLLAVNK